MLTSYSIAPISPETLDRAYPLLRAVAPTLAQEEWRQHCRKLTTRLADKDPANGREEIVVAVNSQGYVKGLCLYSIRDHWIYGRLLGVPIFVVASAADAEGVSAALLRFLQGKCDRLVCSGVRFWMMADQIWDRRLNEEDIRRADHGIFTPAIASFAEIESALSASTLADRTVIERLSR
jgi:hypothetical protein